MASVFEIKKGRKWEQVRATSIMALDTWCEENNIKDWRMVGMMSRAEQLASENLDVVA